MIERVARQAVSRGLSVRQVESLVKRERETNDRPATPPTPPSPAARDLVHKLEQALGTKVKLVEATPKSGHLEVFYNSLDELDAVLAKILR